MNIHSSFYLRFSFVSQGQAEMSEDISSDKHKVKGHICMQY